MDTPKDLEKRKKIWLDKAMKMHPEFDFSLVNFINTHTNVDVICPIHGKFSVQAKKMLWEDYVCPECAKQRKLDKNRDEAIKECRKLYNDYYEYDLDLYKNMNTKIRMICPKHGDFMMSLKYHIKGHKCPKCAIEESAIKRSVPFEDYVERAKKTHKGKYDYIIDGYTNINGNITLVCKTHGRVVANAMSHLRGAKCPMCSKTAKKTNESFESKARTIHGFKYDYSNVEYKNNKEKVAIICHEKDEFGEEHGIFWQTPKIHLRGYGCPKCSGNYLDRDLFIKKANVVHNNKYDYSQVVYKTNHTKVDIICPEHGVFSMKPYSHLYGKQGCPLCKESHLEREIRIFLSNNNIKFNAQQRFDWLRNSMTNYNLPLDFYLPDYNIAIECQGEQHFVGNFYKSKGVEYAQEHLKGVQERDGIKKYCCKKNNVQLIYFTETYLMKYLEDDETPSFSNTNDLLKFLNGKSC